MTTAELFVDAVHTANTVAHRLFWGLVFAAALCVFVTPAVTAAAVWGVGAARDRLGGRETAEEPVPVPESPRRRPAPHWARTQPLNDGKYDHAA